MSPQKIAAALKDIGSERDPNLKPLELASLASALFRARKFIAAALAGGFEIDWHEVGRLANSSQYRILNECEALVGKVARELEAKNPLDTR